MEESGSGMSLSLGVSGVHGCGRRGKGSYCGLSGEGKSFGSLSSGIHGTLDMSVRSRSTSGHCMFCKSSTWS